MTTTRRGDLVHPTKDIRTGDTLERYDGEWTPVCTIEDGIDASQALYCVKLGNRYRITRNCVVITMHETANN